MIVDVNPFVYSRPVPPEDVVDRDAEVADLLRHAVGGHYVRLYAPRKYGKTSLLTRALHDGERSEGLIGVLVDLYRVASVADVTVRLERAYAKHLRGELRGKVESFLQRTGVGLSLGAFGISARLQLDPARDPLPALHALLDLPLRLEASGGFRALHRLRRVPGHRPHRRPRRAAPEPHPASGRGRVVCLRRLGAGSDAPAVRDEGQAALRLRGADAPRPPRGCRPRGLRRAAVRRVGPERGGGAQPAARARRRAPPARDASRPPALGRGGAGRRGHPRRLARGPRGRDARARAGVRRPVARPRRLRPEDASRDHPRRRLAVPHGRAAQARADEGRRPAGAPASFVPRRRSRSGTPAGTRSSTRCSPPGSIASTTGRETAPRSTPIRPSRAGSPTCPRTARSGPGSAPARSR